MKIFPAAENLSACSNSLVGGPSVFRMLPLLFRKHGKENSGHLSIARPQAYENKERKDSSPVRKRKKAKA
ncbi:MAG: hypothetical protein JNJ50_32185 [Acidobacteria bacterium]|nr:hypothetical protein [Acidobacteriota bacterium]